MSVSDTTGPPILVELRTQVDELTAQVATYGPRSVPAELRRDQVISAATIAFLTDGFDQTSMEGIADRIGITKPVIYGLFESKEALFGAVVERENTELTARMVEVTAGAGTGTSRLRPAIREYLSYVQERGELWGAIMAAVHHDAVGQAATGLREHQILVTSAAIGRGYRSRGIKHDPREVEAIAAVVVGAVHAVVEWWRNHPELAPDALADFIEAALAPGIEAVRSGRAAAAAFTTGVSNPVR
jgi:AcrR family transcriptional regulator